jgi:hypothetical protein
MGLPGYLADEDGYIDNYCVPNQLNLMPSWAGTDRNSLSAVMTLKYNNLIHKTGAYRTCFFTLLSGHE